MKWILIILALAATGFLRCASPETAQVCPSVVEYHETPIHFGGFEGVDLLVVIDNSPSMAREREIMTESFYRFINALVAPLPGNVFPAQDDVRVAVVTSDMGLSWGGHPYEQGDGWPGEPICSASGDNGGFRAYAVPKAASIDVAQGVIPCAANGAQCPEGWVCEGADFDTSQGVCVDPSGDGGVACPVFGDEPWAEICDDGENTSFAAKAVCLLDQGSDGCEIEQPLQAAAVALSRPDQADFSRPMSLLVVLVISDEDDCSIEDGPGFFATDEVQTSDTGPSRRNLACGNHPEYLSSLDGVFEAFANAKIPKDAVFFVGLVGVPPVDACQGRGDAIAACLEHDDMQPKEITVETDERLEEYAFEPACERYDGGVLVASATPGRRYVELAGFEFGRMSAIHSICSEDWSPAMEEISALVAANLWSPCFERRLPWDSVTRESICRLVVEVEDVASCPPTLGHVDSTIGATDRSTPAACVIDRLSAPLDCAEVDEVAMSSKLGWYYCERLQDESFIDTCSDGRDNDADGATDCEDDECLDLIVCEGGSEARDDCVYDVVFTEATEPLVTGRTAYVICPRATYADDPNCMENSAKACSDGNDNDLDGFVDCDDRLDERAFADPDCCPMARGEYGDCVDVDTSLCGGITDACRAAAVLNGCHL